MKILKEKTLPLLKRTRLTAEIEHFKKPTPKQNEILKDIASKLKVSEDTISLLHIYPHFGREKAKIIANIYKTKEDKEKFEKINKNPLKQKKKSKESGEQPQQEAPKKETKETKPEKEVKEDGKKESKK